MIRSFSLLYHDTLRLIPIGYPNFLSSGKTNLIAKMMLSHTSTLQVSSVNIRCFYKICRCIQLILEIFILLYCRFTHSDLDIFQLLYLELAFLSSWFDQQLQQVPLVSKISDMFFDMSYCNMNA
jgi:hypothetical protein